MWSGSTVIGSTILAHTHMEAELPTVVMVGKGEDRHGPGPEGAAMISIMLFS